MFRAAALPGLVFALVGCHGAAGGPSPGAAAADTSARTETLRVVTYNIHGGGAIAETPAAEAALRADRAGRSPRLHLAAALGELGADLIALQEVPREEFVAALAQALGMHYAFFPGGWRGRGWPDGIAAAILSRHPIVESASCPLAQHGTRPEELFTRGYGRVVIRFAGQPLSVYVAHLLPAWKNTTHIREGEIREIGANVQRDLARGHSVLVTGDMNHHPAMPEYRLWNEHGLVDTVARVGAGDQRTCPTPGPKERIDYVFAAGPIAKRIVSASVLREKRWGIDPADPASFALSDHLPVSAVFGAPR